MTDFHLRRGADIIRHGGLVAYPTEAVYGLGCDPLNAEAVARLLVLKRRAPEQGMILLAADLDQVLPWVALDGEQQAALAQHWPLATTYLLPPSQRVPYWITGEHRRVAVRVTAHPVAAALARHADTPIVSTSANRSGEPPARNRFQAARRFAGEVDFIITGQCNLARQPSTIVDFETGEVLRG